MTGTAASAAGALAKSWRSVPTTRPAAGATPPGRAVAAFAPLVVAALVGVIGVVAVLVALAVSGSRQRSSSGAPESPRSSPTVVLGRAAPRVPARAGVREAGRRFLRGYVAFLYGRREADELEGASADLRRAPRRARLRVPPGRLSRTPTIVDVRAAVQAPRVVQVTATVDDGDLAAYPVTAFLERRAGRWLVTHVGDD